MTAVTIKAFRGAVPRSGQRLQNPNFASAARNVKITSGRLDPLRGLLPAHASLADEIRTIWRYRHKLNGVNQDHWLVFSDEVDVVGSMIADDEQGRIFWTSDVYEPRMSTYARAIDGAGPYPDDWYMLGVPSPTVKPDVSVSGGTGTNVARSYAYTFATALGEESGPSPASDLDTGFPNGTWAVSNMQTAPANSGSSSSWTPLGTGRIRATLDTTFGMQVGTTLVLSYDTVELTTPIVETHRLLAVDHAAKQVEFERTAYPAGTTPVLTWSRAAPINTAGMVKRIYRTEGTSAAFQFVAEIPVSTTTYNDTATSLTGEVIRTLNTLPPPAKMTSLIELPNGCLVGLVENEVCFSDPYMPYSWPLANRYSFVGKGVKLCAAGNSVIVVTDGYPILLTGSDPEAMSPTTIETYAPCVSRRGAVNVGGGMLYPSHDGLWLATAGAVKLMTRNLYRLDEWKAKAPTTFDAAFHDGQYVATHHPVGSPSPLILVLDIAELDSEVTVDESADAMYRNDYDGSLYLVQGSRILKWDADDSRRFLTEWTSVEMQLDQPRNFSVAQIHADWKQVVPLDTSSQDANQALIDSGPDAVNGHINGGQFLDFEINGSNLVPVRLATERKVQFVLYDGDEAVFATTVDSKTPFRLPSGYKHEILRIGLSASVPVHSVTVAESTQELAQAST